MSYKNGGLSDLDRTPWRLYQYTISHCRRPKRMDTMPMGTVMDMPNLNRRLQDNRLTTNVMKIT